MLTYLCLLDANIVPRFTPNRSLAVGKFMFFDNKTTPRSIDRLGLIIMIKNKNWLEKMLLPWRKYWFCHFFVFPPWRKRWFCRFLHFRHGGNIFFTVFRFSAVAETSFFSFSAHPRPRKLCFSRFLLIRGLGNSVFLVFRSSEASETLFFSFFAHPRPRTDKKSDLLAADGCFYSVTLFE